MKKVVFARRLTLFTPSFYALTDEVRQNLHGVNEAYCIAPLLDPREGGFIAPQPILSSPPIMPDQPWVLQKGLVTFNGSSFRFVGSQIDALNYELAMDESQEAAACNLLLDEYSIILPAFNNEYFTRVAYSPVVALEKEDFDFDGFFAKTFNVPTFNGTVSKDFSFTANYQVNLDLNGRNLLVNCNTTVSKGVRQENNNNNVTTSHNCIIVQLDINTVPRPEDGTFSIADFRAFVDSARTIKDKIIDTLILSRL